MIVLYNLLLQKKTSQNLVEDKNQNPSFVPSAWVKGQGHKV